MELIDGKNVSRAKMLLKVDCEFLRRTISMTARDDLKHIYGESIDALKMLGYQNR